MTLATDEQQKLAADILEGIDTVILTKLRGTALSDDEALAAAGMGMAAAVWNLATNTAMHRNASKMVILESFFNFTRKVAGIIDDKKPEPEIKPDAPNPNSPWAP